MHNNKTIDHLWTYSDSYNRLFLCLSFSIDIEKEIFFLHNYFCRPARWKIEIRWKWRHYVNAIPISYTLPMVQRAFECFYLIFLYFNPSNWTFKLNYLSSNLLNFSLDINSRPKNGNVQCSIRCVRVRKMCQLNNKE